jgi:Cu-Zn family superoxide dismutase
MEGYVKKFKFVVVAAAFCAASIVTAAQAPQTPAAPQAPAGAGQGRGGRGGGRGGAAGAPATPGAPGAAGAPAAGAPQGPARGITINGNPVQKAHADISGPNGITGTADFVEYAMGNGTMVQVIVSVTGLPPGLHGMHIHAVGKCDATTTPPFTSAGGHFDPGPYGNMDADLNHPFHSGDLPAINGNATGPSNLTTYSTRFNLGGPLSLFGPNGTSIVIHANPDTYSTGTAGQGVAGGPRLACGVINKT